MSTDLHDTLRSQQHDADQDGALDEHAEPGIPGQKKVKENEDHCSNDRTCLGADASYDGGKYGYHGPLNAKCAAWLDVSLIEVENGAGNASHKGSDDKRIELQLKDIYSRAGCAPVVVANCRESLSQF